MLLYLRTIDIKSLSILPFILSYLIILTQIHKYLKNSSNLVLNPTVEKCIEIFKQVEKLEILNDLPGDTSLKTIFKKISSNFYSIEKNTGAVYWLNNPK